MNNSYMYLFVRGDLSVPQQIIQTAHAVEDICQKIRMNKTSHAVLFSADSEDDLFKASEWLSFHEIRHSMFYEPDIEAYTSIATEPLSGKKRSVMKSFKMKK